MKKQISILIIVILFANSLFSQEDSTKTWQFGLKTTPAMTGWLGNIEKMRISYSTGLQIKRKVFRSFDLVSGLHYSNYNSMYYGIKSIQLINNLSEFKEYEHVQSLYYLSLPVFIRYNFKKFFGILGVNLEYNLGNNRHHIKELDFNMKLEDINKLTYGFVYGIGYQFKLNEKLQLDIELSASSLSYNYTDKRSNSEPFVKRYGVGITVYYDLCK